MSFSATYNFTSHGMPRERKKLAAEQAVIDRSYTLLDDWEFPWGWSNDPQSLQVANHFTGLKKDQVKVVPLKNDFGIPDARPILVDRVDTHLIDGGNGKYYLWREARGTVYEIAETDIICTLSLGTKLLGEIE